MRAVEIPSKWNAEAEMIRRAFVPRLRVQMYKESPILSYIRHLEKNVYLEENSAAV